MDVLLEEVVHTLIERKETIATMESCTGGGIANALTCIPGVSEVFHFGAVTYSNGYKIKMGVPKETIDTYTVYSSQVAEAMAHAISEFTTSTYGIGVTGKMNVEDPENPSGDNDTIYYSLYHYPTNSYVTKEIKVHQKTRRENKKVIIKAVMEDLKELLK